MPDNQLELLLSDTVQRGASDLHLIHGYPPIQRISNEVTPMGKPALDSAAIWSYVKPYLEDHHEGMFQKELRVNVSFTVNGVGRFRMNLAKAQGTVSASIRSIPSRIYPLSALGLPPIVGSLTQKRRGIIFITGPTGSGKSTTMAAMLDHINREGWGGKIVTIEDPIETLFVPSKSFFLQREVGVDTPSFEMGIEDALRQDPDVIAIGEVRTAESVRAAITAAETGHLVLTTIHTPDSAKTAQRIISMFPGNEQETVRDQLASTLEAVISQDLLPRLDKRGLVLGIEVLLVTPAVRQLVRKGELQQIYDILQTGTSMGMISKDASIKSLFQRQLIAREVAMAQMRDPRLLA